MTRNQFLEKVAAFFEMSAVDLADEVNLQALDRWDSLVILNLIALFDSEFGLSVSFAQIDGCRNVDDLIALSGGRVSA